MQTMTHPTVKQAFQATAAKYHWGDDYPWTISDRGRAAVDVLRQGLADKAIWNVDLKDAVSTLSYEYEAAVKKAEKLSNVSLYRIFNSLESLHTVGATIRRCEQFIKKPVVPDYYFSSRDYEDKGLKTPGDYLRFQQQHIKDVLVPGVQEIIPFLKAWADVQQMRIDLKPFVKMGRKQVGEGKPVYVPPPSSLQSLAEVEKILKDLIESKRVELEKNLFETLMNRVEWFFNKHEGKSPYNFYGHGSPEMPHLIEKMVEHPQNRMVDWKNPVRISKAESDKILRSKAKLSVNAIVENYASKNMAKLTRLIAEKKKKNVGIAEVKDQGMTVHGPIFAGWMLFKFSDNTGFRVLNQVVIKYSPRGLMFAQFPTTFHQVVGPDGKVKAKLSEKQMNEEWL